LDSKKMSFLWIWRCREFYGIIWDKIGGVWYETKNNY